MVVLIGTRGRVAGLVGNVKESSGYSVSEVITITLLWDCIIICYQQPRLKGRAMIGITLLFAYEDRDKAKVFAGKLNALGFKVFSNHIIEDAESTKLSAGQILRNGVSLIVPLLSKNFIRNELEYLEICVSTLRVDRTLIFPISIDDIWYRVKTDAVIALQNTSYITEPPSEESHDYSILAKGVSNHLEKSLSRGVSHQNLRYLESLLEDGVSAVEVIESYSTKDLDGALLRKRNSISQDEQYFIFVGINANLQALNKKIKDDFSYIFQSSLLVIRAVDKDDLLSVKQIQNAQQIFGCNAISFQTLIDRITSVKFPPPTMKLAPSEILISQKLLIKKSDVNGVSEEKTRTDAFIKQFLLRRKSDPKFSFFALLNDGGSGKTHVASYLHDVLFRSGFNELFFFSGRQVDLLKDQGHSAIEISSLYDVYKYSLLIRGEDKPLSKELFHIRFLSQETFFFIDGVEEIQAWLGDRFDQKAFFEDCVALLKLNPMGTIFTTSRSPFWPEENVTDITYGSLSLFSETEKKNFFDRKFPTDPRKAKLAMKIESQISNSQNSRKQLPLFCSCIYYFVESVDDLDALDLDIQNNEFKGRNGLHVLIGYTVNREGKRAGISWRKELVQQALQNFAVESIRGPISKEELVSSFELAFTRKVSANEVRAIEKLIFIENIDSENLYRIRFSFIKTMLLSEYFITSFFKAPIQFVRNSQHNFLLSAHMSPNSDVSACTISTIKSEEDTDSSELSFSDLILLAVAEVAITLEGKREKDKIISNLFYLALEISDAFEKDKATPLLFEFFEDKDSVSKLIRGFKAVDYNNNIQRQPRFDFRGVTLIDCVFDRYDELWKCSADERTQVIDAQINNCSGAPSKNGIAISTFQNLSADADFLRNRTELLNEFNPHEDNVVETLIQYFKLFATNGNFKEYKSESVFEQRYRSRVGMSSKKITKALLKNGVLEKGMRDKPLLRVVPEQIIHVRAFFDNTIPSRDIKNVLSDLKR